VFGPQGCTTILERHGTDNLALTIWHGTDDLKCRYPYLKKPSSKFN
jgi:hypothetical protein